MLGNKNAAYVNFIAIDDKRYKCRYCTQTFVKHPTRMNFHTYGCEATPAEIKNGLKSWVDMHLKKSKNVKENVSPNKVNHETSLNEDANNSQQQNYLSTLLSRALISTKTTFSISENKYWKEFMAAGMPSFSIPNSSVLLECLENEKLLIQADIDRKLQSATTYSFQIEMKKDRSINIFIHLDKAVLYKILITDNHSEENDIFIDIKKELVKQKVDRCIGISCNLLFSKTPSWALLKQDIDLNINAIPFYVNIEEILENLLDDILTSPTFVNHKRVMKTVFNDIFLNSVVDKAFKSIQTTLFGSAVDLSEVLQSHLMMFQVSCDRIVALKHLVISSDCKSDLPEALKNHLSDIRLWENISLCYTVVQELSKWILISQSSDIPLSQAAHIINRIQTVLDNPSLRQILLQNEMTKIKDQVWNARKELSTLAHLASNLLDPRYKGCDLSPIEDRSAVQFIVEFGSRLKMGSAEDLLQEVANYRTNEGFWNCNFLWSSNMDKPKLWWNSFCGATLLRKIASALFSLPANFPVRGKEPCMEAETLRSLTYVSFNM